ncbi:MAG: Uma2 family endonuclease [Lachnospiraceae bacterium]|nr:Uma2 family endonuclease [Lachnospiraceae bacterium]
MPLPKQQTYTTDYIYSLPDGERAELIDGVIYNMSPPSYKHQKILSFLHIEIGSYIRSKNGKCEIIPAPFAVFLTKDNTNYVEPDISVICDKTKLTDKGCNGAPDWIIEIVSPSSKKLDYMVKLFKYCNAGVREYWIVDPLKNQIRIYNFETNDNEDYTFADCVKVGIYEDLEIDFSKIY